MITVFTDAAASGDPGPSAAGIVIKQGTNFTEYSFFLGEHSNHEAEFLAVIRALELCKERFPNEIISIRSDAKVVVDTMDQAFTKNKNFQPYVTMIQQLESHFAMVLYKWIPEKQNKQADQLARTRLRIS